jgi:hypothetical protein
MSKSYSILAILAVSPVLPVCAQMQNADSQLVDSVQQRQQLTQAAQPMIVTNVPDLYDGESDDVGPQSVVKLKPARTWFEARGDVQYFHTDNMFLANSGKQGADVLVGTVEAALAPTPYDFAGGQLAPQLGFQEQWFNYGLASSGSVNVYNPYYPFSGSSKANLDQFDFNVQTVYTDAAWRRDNWTFTLGADYRRLLDSGSYDEFYKEWVPRWAIRRDFLLSETTMIALGYDGDYRLTDTPNSFTSVGRNFNDRADNSLSIVGSWRLCRYAVLQPYYFFDFTHYTTIHRNDLLHTFGLALYVPINDQVSLRLFATYDNFKTDGYYVQSYQKLDLGGGLNFVYRF